MQAVRFEGNKQVKTTKLQKEISTKTNSALDEHTVKADVEKLHEYYQKHGYNQVQVTYDIERDRSSGYGTVIYKIREGEKVRIADIRFTGNNHLKAKQLRKQMETKRWWMFSWLTGAAGSRTTILKMMWPSWPTTIATTAISTSTSRRTASSTPIRKPGRMVITIHVDEGRQYRIGDISITGSKLYSEDMLKLVLRQKERHDLSSVQAGQGCGDAGGLLRPERLP